MKAPARYSVLILLLCAGVLAQDGAKQPLTSVDEIVSRVQHNVEQTLTSLPDFLCDEQITNQEIYKGKLRFEKKAVSVIRSIRTKHAGTENDFEESREVRTINGKPAEGQELDLPFAVNGASGAALATVFGPGNIRCFDFRVTGSEQRMGNTVLVLSVTGKENAKDLGGACASKTPGAGGTLLIATEEMQVVSMDHGWRPLKLHRTADGETVNGIVRWSVEFRPVTIGERSFWMPATSRAEAVMKDSPRRLLYLAEYSNYHKFNVTAKIVTDAESVK
jgi:hypothetical protein